MRSSPPIERLARTMWYTGWLPPSAQVIDRPELCCVVSPVHPGQNAVVRFRPVPDGTHALMDEVSSLYGEAPCKFGFYPHVHGPDVVDALEQHGFRPGKRHDARILPVDSYRPRPSPGITVRQVQTLDDVRQLYDLRSIAFGEPNTLQDADLRHYLAGCTGPDTMARQFMAFDETDGTPIAQAGLALHTSVQLGFFFAGATLEAHRGRGAYSALVAARVAYAKRAGFDAVGLFAVEDTSSPIVARQGFRQCGTMTYWQR